MPNDHLYAELYGRLDENHYKELYLQKPLNPPTISDSSERLYAEFYDRLDEHRHKDLYFQKPLNLPTTSDSSKPLYSGLYKRPDEVRYEEEEELNEPIVVKKRSFFQRIWWMWSRTRLWDGSWFHYPVIPPGPWKTVYGCKPIPKRCAMRFTSPGGFFANEVNLLVHSLSGTHQNNTILVSLGLAVRKRPWTITYVIAYCSSSSHLVLQCKEYIIA
ncbi:hypothetical protein M413DRAFT_27936 [Hebeloma cylindrosporum]|uniref:Uncharacterized protein n=1 Tax=Hebeloma cylindrosporum TaxID=76867 RepID=A0A0C3CDH3_HEBCY|nr:hypothetical protein M413DRAFT_27936 [Hebeloma cylindrosporum h7]